MSTKTILTPLKSPTYRDVLKAKGEDSNASVENGMKARQYEANLTIIDNVKKGKWQDTVEDLIIKFGKG